MAAMNADELEARLAQQETAAEGADVPREIDTFDGFGGGGVTPTEIDGTPYEEAVSE